MGFLYIKKWRRPEVFVHLRALALVINILRFDTVLSVSEKLPLLKFQFFENYKRNVDSYFTFHVSGQLKTRLEQ